MPTSAQTLLDPVALALLERQRLERAEQLLLRRLGRVRVRVEDAGLGLDHVGQGRERHTFAVRMRAALAPVDQVRVGVDPCVQLSDEPALADARHADDGHELRRPLLARAVERVEELVELAAPADERGRRPGELDVDSGARLERLPDDDRLRLALDLDGIELAIVDRVRRHPVGRLANENAVHRRRGLQPRRRVDDVTRRDPLALGRPRVDGD